MGRRDARTNLHDIVPACENAVAHAGHVTEAEYIADRKTRSAVEREMEVAAEALGRLLREKPELLDGWKTDVRAVAAFRNRLVHEYHHIDDREVCRIVREDVPLLLAEAAGTLSRLN